MGPLFWLLQGRIRPTLPDFFSGTMGTHDDAYVDDLEM